MKVYMEITQDELALPLCVCEHIYQLAQKTGLQKTNVSSQVSKSEKGIYKYPRFIKVEIEEDSIE